MIAKFVLNIMIILGFTEFLSTMQYNNTQLAEEYQHQLKGKVEPSKVFEDLVGKEVNRRNQQNQTTNLFNFTDRISHLVLRTRILDLFFKYTANLPSNTKTELLNELGITKDDLEKELTEAKMLARTSKELKQEDIDKLANFYLRWRQVVKKCDNVDVKFLVDKVLSKVELEAKQFCSQLAFLAMRLPKVSIQVPETNLKIGLEEILKSLKNIGDSNTRKTVQAIYELPDPVPKAVNSSSTTEISIRQ